ncbi:MAG: hypothetical protein GEU90_04050 [Gemmatimonas sp.]|nr:hypothetical protein [Gemmatimonas sp.]
MMKPRIVDFPGRRWTAALLFTVLLAGCYRQVPVSLENVGPSSRVRVSLSPAATDAVMEVIGLRQSTVTARVADVGPTSVSLLLPSAHGDPISGRRNLFQEVYVDRDDILGVQRLEFSRGRTGLSAAAVAIGAIAVGVALFSGESGSSPEFPGGGSEEALIPLRAERGH